MMKRHAGRSRTAAPDASMRAGSTAREALVTAAAPDGRLVRLPAFSRGAASLSPCRHEASALSLQSVPDPVQQAAHAIPVTAARLVPHHLDDPSAVQPHEREMAAVNRAAH